MSSIDTRADDEGTGRLCMVLQGPQKGSPVALVGNKLKHFIDFVAPP